MKLKQLRQMSGLSQVNFAKQFNISQNALSNYENGIRDIGIDLLKKISQKYNCTIDYLLDNDLIDDDRISNALVEERKRYGYSLEELSFKTKIPLHDLKAYEEGLEPINEYLLNKICKTYGITTNKFYFETDIYDDFIPEIFNGNVDAYEKFKASVDEDAESEQQTTYSTKKYAYINEALKDALTNKLNNYTDAYPKITEKNSDANKPGNLVVKKGILQTHKNAIAYNITFYERHKTKAEITKLTDSIETDIENISKKLSTFIIVPQTTHDSIEISLKLLRLQLKHLKEAGIIVDFGALDPS